MSKLRFASVPAVKKNTGPNTIRAKNDMYLLIFFLFFNVWLTIIPKMIAAKGIISLIKLLRFRPVKKVIMKIKARISMTSSNMATPNIVWPRLDFRRLNSLSIGRRATSPTVENDMAMIIDINQSTPKK